MRLSLTSRPVPAFPNVPAGRLPHSRFRGLLSVHSRCSPHGRWIAQGDPFHRSASNDVVTSIIRSDCYRLERQFAGRDSHPLRDGAFPRHTVRNQEGRCRLVSQVWVSLDRFRSGFGEERRLQSAGAGDVIRIGDGVRATGLRGRAGGRVRSASAQSAPGEASSGPALPSSSSTVSTRTNRSHVSTRLRWTSVMAWQSTPKPPRTAANAKPVNHLNSRNSSRRTKSSGEVAGPGTGRRAGRSFGSPAVEGLRSTRGQDARAPRKRPRASSVRGRATRGVARCRITPSANPTCGLPTSSDVRGQGPRADPAARPQAPRALAGSNGRRSRSEMRTSTIEPPSSHWRSPSTVPSS